MKEIFKDINGYEGLYQISNFGRVKSLEKKAGNSKRKEKFLKSYLDKDGYKRVALCKNNKVRHYSVHRIVADAYLDKTKFSYMEYEDKNQINIEKLQINHKDENPANNKFDNLEWCTLAYNINYGSRTKKAIGKRKIKINQYELDGTFIKTWECMNDAIKFYKNSSICWACSGKKETASGYKWEYMNRRIDL